MRVIVETQEFLFILITSKKELEKQWKHIVVDIDIIFRNKINIKLQIDKIYVEFFMVIKVNV